MELLGNSLENLFQENKKKFSLKTTCMIGIQMIERIKWIHDKRIIHRDIKPDNFVIGRGDNSHIIYLLDFGLSKKYWSSKTNLHIKFSMNRKLTGTARYASINALKGYEQSRRDDLEAIGYVLMYFLRGSLPWQGLPVNRREDRYKKIYEKKKNTSPEDLCLGFPSEMISFVKYTRGLEFEADPDYNYLKGLLQSIMTKNSFEYDYFFDWCKEKPEIKEEYKKKEEEMDEEFQKKFEKINVDTENDIQTPTGGNTISKTDGENHERLETNVANYNLTVHSVSDENKEEEEKKKDEKSQKKDKKEKKKDKKKKSCNIM